MKDFASRMKEITSTLADGTSGAGSANSSAHGGGSVCGQQAGAAAAAQQQGSAASLAEKEALCDELMEIVENVDYARGGCVCGRKEGGRAGCRRWVQCWAQRALPATAAAVTAAALWRAGTSLPAVPSKASAPSHCASNDTRHPAPTTTTKQICTRSAACPRCCRSWPARTPRCAGAPPRSRRLAWPTTRLCSAGSWTRARCRRCWGCWPTATPWWPPRRCWACRRWCGTTTRGCRWVRRHCVRCWRLCASSHVLRHAC
jgi:hypothetical protein